MEYYGKENIAKKRDLIESNSKVSNVKPKVVFD